MIYKTILSILILQSTFFGANEFADLEAGTDTHRTTKKTSCIKSTECHQVTGSLALASAAIMHGVAAYCALLTINKNENPDIKKALIASAIGNGVAAAGDALAAIVAPFSGKGTATILTFTYGVSFWAANVPSWVAISMNDSTNTRDTLTASACLGSLSIIPAAFGVPCAFAANNDGH